MVSWNPGARRLKGYDADEIMGRNFAVFYTDEDRQVGKPAGELEHASRRGSLTDTAGGCARTAPGSGPMW